VKALSFKIHFALILAFGFAVQASYADVPEFLKNFPKQSFHQLKSGEQVVGKSHIEWEPFGSRIKFKEKSQMKLTLFKKQQEIWTSLEVETDDKIRFHQFTFSMKTQGADIQIKGLRADDLVKFEVRQAGNIQFKEVRVQEPVLLGPLVRPYLLMRGLPKKEFSQAAYLLEPSAMTVVPLNIKVAKSVQKDLWNLTVDYLSQKLLTTLDKDGRSLYEKSDLAGLPIVATPISAATYKTLKLQGTKRDLVEVAKVKFPKLPNARTLSKFIVSLDGVDLKDFQLTRHRQKLEGKKLAIQLEQVPATSVPVQSLVGQKALEKYLVGETTVPVYHADIQKITRELVGTENDVWKRALIIHNFVYREIEKVPTISVPNALEVLKTKRGDCNEHAVLYTALARAAGVPTRTVVGLVYSDLFYGKPGFYYHAWVEVFTGKEWISLDPTWNQIPADVTHIAFVEGGLDQQVLVTSLMGKIKVLPVDPALGAAKPAAKTN
jgi:hypothetical protein